MDLTDLDVSLESGVVAKGKDKIAPTSDPTSLWREWKDREVAAEEWTDVNLEENSTIDQNKVKKKLKPKRSNQKATIITTGNSSAINGEKRKIGVGSCMREKEKGKVRVGVKVGIKVTVPSHIPADMWKLTLPEGSNQNTSNPK